ncbi:MAG TPA: amidohydrolase family protein [Noviherbaspirillum sp.]|uniref:amidohydrolase family protein n=1 Tax=Noviherbaspirillum sp. TaxID=1926288 RepID=UPI002B482FDD|nr:amidohydrolase family protein [Noviherbaspirillum sp.]HJV85407.1 amidohydrolase family protein [Noviherbaspirillum sp.]
MKKIALEEAFAVPGIEKLTPGSLSLREFTQKMPKLLDLGEERLQAMDENEVEISVLSTTCPGIQGIVDASQEQPLARQWNDYLAEAVARHPTRYRGFAALPMRDPEAAAEELTRAVKELGMVGAMINGYDNSGDNPPTYYDAPEYVDFWKTAAALDVPVYLHPRTAPAERITYAGFPEMRGAAWGFHVETGEHVLRMILSGLFDKVPSARLVIGHMGELLPYWAWRIDHRIAVEGWDQVAAETGRGRKHTVTEYLKRNITITTSGTFDTPGLVHAISVMGHERVLFSIDYPYEDAREACDWMDGVDLPYDVKEAIAYTNAKKFLKLA